MSATALDAIVVGAGPNGLVAAAVLAGAGRSVLVVEAEPTLGGGTRSAALTEPGFLHDICSAIHPLGVASPAFADLDLARHGLRWLHPEVVLAHPLDGGRAALVHRELEATAVGLGPDGKAWRRHIGGTTRRFDDLVSMLMRPALQLPAHPGALAAFAPRALMPADRLAERWFDGDEARALFAGCAAHAVLPLSRPLTSGFALLLLGAAHAVGWPVAAGGSQQIAEALVSVLSERGVRIETGRRVRSMADLPTARAVLFDLAPRQVAAICAERLPAPQRARLERFRHGPGVFKLDLALSEPVPWANDGCRVAGTLHLGGTAQEIAHGEAEVAAGRHPERPLVLIAQPSVVDPTRAPPGCHTLWAYCHVPNSSDVDMTTSIEAQIERFAPGFLDVVRARHAAGPAWFEEHDGAYVGGDITGGAHSAGQLLFRPLVGRPYRTADPAILMCSASTPPGAGVHGMCGANAARVALRTVLR